MSVELIQGRTYLVGHATIGLFFGRFLGQKPTGELIFDEVTEFVDVVRGEKYQVSPEGLVDAEQWSPQMALVNYAEVNAADTIAKSLARRNSVNVNRCKAVDVDTE